MVSSQANVIHNDGEVDLHVASAALSSSGASPPVTNLFFPSGLRPCNHPCPSSGLWPHNDLPSSSGLWPGNETLFFPGASSSNIHSLSPSARKSSTGVVQLSLHERP